LKLDLTDSATHDTFGYLEMHPDMENGMFADKNKVRFPIRRVDKVQDAQKSYGTREKRITAASVAMNYTQAEARDFAAAIGWDENEDLTVLKENILQMAEEQTDDFTKIAESNIVYKSTIKRAITKQVIEFVPMENKFVWASNKQTVAVLERTDGSPRDTVERLCEWLETTKNGEEIYNRMSALLKPEKPAQPSK
jgi:hypothetical protein